MLAGISRNKLGASSTLRTPELLNLLSGPKPMHECYHPTASITRQRRIIFAAVRDVDQERLHTFKDVSLEGQCASSWRRRRPGDMASSSPPRLDGVTLINHCLVASARMPISKADRANNTEDRPIFLIPAPSARQSCQRKTRFRLLSFHQPAISACSCDHTAICTHE